MRVCVMSSKNRKRRSVHRWENRTLGSAAGTTSVAAHGDSLLVVLDVLKEGDGALELPSVDSLSGLTGVLEGHTEVGTAGAGRLGGLNLGRSVSGLH